MKKLLLVIVAALLLSGCFDSQKQTQERQFEWGVKFCGGQNKVAAFSANRGFASRIHCLDGRWSDIPR